MFIADTLSRASLSVCKPEIDENEMEAAVHMIIQNIPATNSRIESIKAATAEDKNLQAVAKLVEYGWPQNKINVPQEAMDYWTIRDELHMAEGLLFLGERLVIPASERQHTLNSIHEGHLGIEKCKARACSCVYWPRMTKDIEDKVKMCGICNKY